MKFQPKSENEIVESNLWSDGVYDFSFTTAEDKTSKNGNDMIAVKLSVYNSEGDSITVFDYLMEKMLFKLNHAAYSVGLGEKYEDGDLNAVDFEGRSGKLFLSRQPAQDGYPAKNVVKDYILPSGETNVDLAKELNDDVPFTWVLALALSGFMMYGQGFIA